MPRFKKALNNRWFVAGLSLLALVLVARTALPSGPDAARAPARVAPPPAVPAAPAPDQAAAPAEAAARPSVAASSDRDPFAARPRVVLGPPVVDTAHLTALWTENGETLALVNGRILRPGDAVGRMTIASATQDGVWVAHARGRDFIELGGTFVLTTPAAAAAAVASSP